MSEAGTLVTRKYSSFRGVDFAHRGDEVSLVRSPDALNMWKNYKNSNGDSVETRPDIELLKTYSDTIFGLFFYMVKGTTHKIQHIGTKLYDEDKVIYSNMARANSKYFVYGGKLYIKDGTSYLVYDGTTVSEVAGYVPTTSIGRKPSGGGTIYEDVNLLTGLRKNSFVADGASKEYVLDVESFDSGYMPKVWVNGEEKIGGFTATPENGTITFTTAPTEPATTGQDNVVIQFRKTVNGYRERIEKCTLLEVFDNRVFFSQNPDYPNVVWHSSLDDPTYCSDLDYYEENGDDNTVQALIVGNNALWVVTDKAVFYHNPTIDSDYGKIYPSVRSSIGTGCVSTGTNFADDIVFFTERGLEGITSDVTTEQFISGRSSLINNKLLNESEYKNVILAEYLGYLLVATGNTIYLADSRAKTTVNDHKEYDWWYWKLDKKITGLNVHNGILYVISDKELYTLTNNKEDREVEAYLCTLEDEVSRPQYQKTTNKRGFTIDCEGKSITVSVKTDNSRYEKIDTFKETKGFIVPKVKRKKWKAISIKISSKKPFAIYSATLEAYVGNYLKKA